MLNVYGRSLGRNHRRGFSLIEMMVAILIGAVVLIGALVVILAINQANSENIQSVRVHQELRALASVVGDELKRARRLNDAMSVIGTGVNSTSTCTTSSPCPGPFDSIDTSTAGCIKYGYQDKTQNDPSITLSSNNYRAMYFDSTSKSLYLYVNTGATNFPACPTSAPASPWVKLNSAQVSVTGMTFSCLTFGTSVSTSTTIPKSCAEIQLTLTAQLAFKDVTQQAAPVTYTYTLPIYIRSGSVVTS